METDKLKKIVESTKELVKDIEPNDRSAAFSAVLTVKLLEYKQGLTEIKVATIDKSTDNSATAAVALMEDKTPVFNVEIAGNRREQQKVAILLYMDALKRAGESAITSVQISRALLRAGIDTERINNAFSALKKGSPRHISSKLRSKEIFLTPDGEREARHLSTTLTRKTNA